MSAKPAQVLVTRRPEQAQPLIHALQQAGCEVQCAPLCASVLLMLGRGLMRLIWPRWHGLFLPRVMVFAIPGSAGKSREV